MTCQGWCTTGGEPGSGDAITSSVIFVKLAALPDDGTLNSIGFYSGFYSGSDPVRVALYKNGTVGSSPAGATLVEDLGTVTPVNGGWVDLNSTTNPAILATDVLWVALKCAQASGSLFIAYTGSNPSNGIAGTRFLGSDESADETDGWDATVSNPTSSAARWNTVRIDFSAASKPSRRRRLDFISLAGLAIPAALNAFGHTFARSSSGLIVPRRMAA